MANEVLTEVIEQVGVLRINRPDKLNALNLATMEQLVAGLQRFDDDPAVRCMLLAGSERAFAAGADIAEMADATMVEMYQRDQFARWERIRRIKKPIVGAVSGYDDDRSQQARQLLGEVDDDVRARLQERVRDLLLVLHVGGGHVQVVERAQCVAQAFALAFEDDSEIVGGEAAHLRDLFPVPNHRLCGGDVAIDCHVLLLTRLWIR